MRKLLFSAILGVCFLGLMGCGSSSKSRLRVVHASPDAANLDVLLDGKAILTNIAYGGGSSGYITLSAGSHKLDFDHTGTTTMLFPEATLSFTDKTDSTVLVVGPAASATSDQLTDDNTAPASGKAKLRLVHASPTIGNVDLYITAVGADITTLQPTVAGVAFKSPSDYQSLDAGSTAATTYEIHIVPTGTKADAITPVPTINLTAGQIRTGLILDASGGGTPFKVTVLADVT